MKRKYTSYWVQEYRGCKCTIDYYNNGVSVRVGVHRLDDPSVGRYYYWDLINPYAFFGFDYEDSKEIDQKLEEYLDRYGDPEPPTVSFRLGVPL